MSEQIPIIAIIGRPNVGKSTLFNTILARKKAVVEDFEGVTRDRNYALVNRYSIPFYIVDTGGFLSDPKDEIESQVIQQVKLAIEEADIIFAVFDGNFGIHPYDTDIVDILRRSKKRTFFLVNKCDGIEQANKKIEFFSLGVDDVRDISALHGLGIRDLVEEAIRGYEKYEEVLRNKKEEEKKDFNLKEFNEEQVSKVFDEEESYEIKEENLEIIEEITPNFAPVFVPEDSNYSLEEYEKLYKTSIISSVKKEVEEDKNKEILEKEELPKIDCIKLAIVGKPNVGKSSLINKIIGENRLITSKISGTIRDAIDVEVNRDGQNFVFIDTAGLRKKSRILEKIETYSVMKTLRILSECDVAVVVIDGQVGAQEQDVKIVGIAHDLGKGIVIAVNKWDLVKKDEKEVREFEKDLREATKFASYARLNFVSALTGKNCSKVLSEAKQIAINRVRKIPTSLLNKSIKKAFERNNPPNYRGALLKSYYASQIKTMPPKFALFLNYPKAMNFSYARYLKNCIRDDFGFIGTDIKLAFVKRRTAN